MDITRRNFFGAAALAALGVGSASALGSLAGCAPSVSTEGDNEVEKTQARELNPQDETYSTCSDNFSALFEPLQMGAITLRNRIVKSPAGSDTWAPDGDVLNANFLDYYENFAKGGASLVFVESSISKLMSYKPLEQKATGWLLDDMSKIPEKMAP